MRALLAEYDKRRALASRERESVIFAVEVTLEGEGGERFEGTRDTVTMPMASPTRAYVAGRAIEHIDGDWVLRRPTLWDLVSDTRFDAHCLTITDANENGLTIVRFEPRDDIAGPQLSGSRVFGE